MDMAISPAPQQWGQQPKPVYHIVLLSLGVRGHRSDIMPCFPCLVQQQGIACKQGQRPERVQNFEGNIPLPSNSSYVKG